MKEIHVSTYMEDKIARRNRLIAVTSITSLAAAGTSIALNIPAAGIIPAITGAVLVYRQLKGYAAWKAGLRGEDMLKEHLRSILTDDYTALYNVPARYGDIDCLVLGPKGLCVMEVKHHKGYISYTDNTWQQIKTGRGGTEYQGSLKNPSAQLMRNIQWLKRYLGMNTWINGMIVFTNPEVQLFVDDLKGIQAVKLEDLDASLLDDISPQGMSCQSASRMLQLMAA